MVIFTYNEKTVEEIQHSLWESTDIILVCSRRKISHVKGRTSNQIICIETINAILF